MKVSIMELRKNRVVASSVLLASLASSFSGSLSASAAKPFLLKRASNWLGDTKNKLKAAGAAAVLAASGYFSDKYVYVKKIPTIKDSEGLIDITTTARYASQMYWADPGKFSDRIKNEDFYKLYDAYKCGYIPFTSIFGVNEQQEKDFKKKLSSEMERRLNTGELTLYLKSKILGRSSDDFIKLAPLFVRACINYDPETSNSVPVFFLGGESGEGKTYGTDLLTEYLSGNKAANRLPLVNAGKEQVDTMINGVTKSYKGSDEPPVLYGFQLGNKMTTPVLCDEADKMDKKAIGSLLTPMQDKKATNRYDGSLYEIKTPVIMTGNFKKHEFKEGWNLLLNRGPDNMRTVLSEDLKEFGGEPLVGRMTYIAYYGAQLYEDKLNIVEMYLKKTQGKSNTPNFYIDSNLSIKEKSKLLGQILDKVQEQKGQDTTRDISNSACSIAEDILRKQHPYEGSYSGLKVQLSLDAAGNVVTTIL